MALTPGLPSSVDPRPALFARALAALGALFLVGCASPGPYRTDADARHQIIETGPAGAYQVGYVEFDEQGWFWMPDSGTGDISYREQMRKVQNMVTDAAQLDPTRPKAAQGIVLVAFVHGWRNNAAPDPDDNNVAKFKGLLQHLADGERARAPLAPRKVVGVYIGWPGLSYNVEPLETASFYSRKNTADRVGLYGGVTEVLSRLEYLNDSINDSLRDNAPASVFIVMGHSFGAQVVSGSLLQIMTQRLAEGKVSKYLEDHRIATAAAPAVAPPAGPQLPPGGRPVQPFGDLVVLVNPAFEGERYFNLKTLAEQFLYPDNQRPVLAVFCSETDSATHTWFPIGRFFSTFWDRYRPGPLGDQQHRANLHTIPWTDDFVTHQLLTADEYIKAYGPVAPETQWNGTTRGAPWRFADCVLRPNPTNQSAWTPFYVVKVDQEIMNGHDDIWGDLFSNFLEEFIAQTDKKSAADAPHRIARASRAPRETAPPTAEP
jgi:hypothetical protein